MSEYAVDSAVPIQRLIAVMGRLRRECGWTREQTHESLRGYLIEEAYEAAEALGSGDSQAMKDELGDVLMQVVFHAEIADSGNEGWGFDDIATAIANKLVRRSPHVFGDVQADTPEEIDALWQKIKSHEKESVPDAAPKQAALPSLVLAQQHLERIGTLPNGDSLPARVLRIAAEARELGIDLELALREELRLLSEKSQG